MEFTCPLCLEGTKQTMLFSCQHYACKPCLEQFSEPTAEFMCPLCKQQVTCLPAHWMDSKEDLKEDSKEDLREDLREDLKDLKSQSSFPKIIDPRGYDMISVAEKIRGTTVDTADRTDAILEASHRDVMALEMEMEQKIQQIRREYELKKQKFKKQCDILLDEESVRLKRAHHEQQAIASVADTITSLAYQPSEVIDQFLPQIQQRIETYTLKWPFGISPFCPDGKVPYTVLTYVPEVSDFVYFSDGHMYLGPYTSDEIGRPASIKVIKGKIYAFCLGTWSAYCYIYDLSLKYLEAVELQHKIAGKGGFYVGETGPQVERSVPSEHCIEDYVDGVLYKGDSKGITAQKQGCSFPVRISRCPFFFFKDGKIQFYSHCQTASGSPMTVLDMGFKPGDTIDSIDLPARMARSIKFHGHGHFYPGMRDSVLYKCGDDCKIIFPDLPTHEYQTIGFRPCRPGM